MAISTIALTEKALKDFYLSVIRDQLNDKAGPFLSLMEKSSEQVSGKKIKMPLKYGRSGGVSSKGENDILPEPSPRQYDIAEWDTKNIYARIMLTDKLIRASRDNRGAFAKMLESQLEDITNDAKDNFYRQLFGDGTGVVATCDVNTSTTTLAVDSVKYLSEGQFIDVLNSDGTEVATLRTILSRDKANNTITISGSAITTVATDIVVISGSFGNELTGLKSIFTKDSILYGINRSTHKWFNANTKALNGELDEITMQEMIDEADVEAGSKINYIQCGHGVARAFQYLQLSYKRNIEYMQMQGGFRVMSYGGTPISREKYEEDGVMRFLNSENFKIYRMDDWDWINKSNHMQVA